MEPPRPSSTSDLANTGDALKSYITKEESERPTLCSGHHAVQHTSERPLNGNVALGERAPYGDNDLLAPPITTYKQHQWQTVPPTQRPG